MLDWQLECRHALIHKCTQTQLLIYILFKAYIFCDGFCVVLIKIVTLSCSKWNGVLEKLHCCATKTINSICSHIKIIKQSETDLYLWPTDSASIHTNQSHWALLCLIFLLTCSKWITPTKQSCCWDYKDKSLTLCMFAI